MAISFSLPQAISHKELEKAWLNVIARHGTLRTTFSTDPNGQVQAHRIDISAGSWVEHPIAPGESINNVLRTVLNRQCSPYSRPSHSLCIIDAAPRPTVIIGSDHSHVDMWSMLVIVRDLMATISGNTINGATLSETPLAFEDHTQVLLEAPAAPVEIHQRWKEIIEAGGGKMPQFPLPLGDSVARQERVEVRDIFGVNDLAIYSARARSEGVSTLSLTASIMAEVTHEIADQPLRAVFPVHSRFDERWHDSVGWFITNSVIELNADGPKAAAKAVREAVQLGSYPLAEVLKPWGGMPETPGMLAISWLDLRRLPVSIDDIGLDAQYVSASIRTDGVMVWFILDRSGAHLRCRYPDTAEARHNVGRWLDGIVATMRTTARGVQLTEEFQLSRGQREDLPEIARLLGNGNGASLEALEIAFDVLTHESSHFLAVVRDRAGAVVAAMQLTIIPDLAHGGGLRLEVEGPHVIPALRGSGLEEKMLAWAEQHGRARGARVVEPAAI
ncbi:condensation domain-containing protein [Corynebacterium callunae]|uniref:condensation domain-containing protein n=1 Tax=Corynebacterium callunae TaxID=1721 RepID=UPI003981B4CE